MAAAKRGFISMSACRAYYEASDGRWLLVCFDDQPLLSLIPVRMCNTLTVIDVAYMESCYERHDW